MSVLHAQFEHSEFTGLEIADDHQGWRERRLRVIDTSNSQWHGKHMQELAYLHYIAIGQTRLFNTQPLHEAINTFTLPHCSAHFLTSVNKPLGLTGLYLECFLKSGITS
ncbi:hypothetical protein AMELA_G00126800 [Ameiurus melas]|uniref:Uncharacterized protein n=1 Tax=Ameiurus melas TaxID=219545 RepID=A0A7J6ARZ4_AMEME|nr:hypothetical protein AMELA_G00126800 [Ameiurus melas]